MAALEQALLQSLHQRVRSGGASFVDSASTDSPSQEELLRRVGCSRLRAALLNQAAQQLQAPGSPGGGNTDSGSAWQSSSGASTSGAVGSGSVDVSSARSPFDLNDVGVSDYEEYFEDYTSGVVSSSQSAYAAQVRLRGADSQAAVAGMSDADGDGQAVSDANYGYADYYESVSTSARQSRLEAAGSLKDVLGRGMDGEGVDASEERVLQLLEDADFFSRGNNGAVTPRSSESTSSSSFEVFAASKDAGETQPRGEYSYFDFYDTDEYYDSLDMTSFVDDGFDLEDDGYDDYSQVIILADAMLAKFEMEARDEEWADYIEQSYEYFTVYFDDDAYSSYTDVLVEDVPNALAALASIAELVVWSQMGNFVLEVRPGFVQIASDGASTELGPVLVLSGEMYSDGGYPMTMLGLQDAQMAAEEQPQVDIVHNLHLNWFAPDGSLNWGLVTLCILGAGTAAMVVGFVASWISLRRSMAGRWVFVPQPHGKRCTPAGKGFDKGCAFGQPLMLSPKDCWGAVAVEHAAQYVPTKLANESVAKALSK